MEFNAFLREKYYEYCEECACYKESPLPYDEYVETNRNWLKEMYDGEKERTET